MLHHNVKSEIVCFMVSIDTISNFERTEVEFVVVKKKQSATHKTVTAYIQYIVSNFI